MSTEVKILHSSCCATASPIRAQIEKIASENHLDVNITEFSDLKDTMPYGVLTFPALVIDGKVYDYKKVSNDKVLLAIL
ncbi:thioredoxin family protein [Flagellimonas taeanensis]|uniref:Thioredoxin family protein n=6 Tax=Flagellimonas TaxID=444459 RepID=A0A4S8RR45_9FLAO|nr:MULTISPECIES: thioredoxin family protein [Allomuricauda]KAB5487036.1 thioredoxin family protein [Allomuricauda hadalis]MBW8244102.1 thioredoxin family protein [Allomuricauda oceani]QII45073.1 thioredoxin family protein [Allomuricauda oceani]RIV45216.1 thioredoxin family protein [Allomuricauda maritima]RIV52278.1 thioredoxin family protein [Allomuricauda taeanensis]